MSLTLPITMINRQWNVSECFGDIFKTDGDYFEGIALTIEIRDADEARAVVEAITNASQDARS